MSTLVDTARVIILWAGAVPDTVRHFNPNHNPSVLSALLAVVVFAAFLLHSRRAQ